VFGEISPPPETDITIAGVLFTFDIALSHSYTMAGALKACTANKTIFYYLTL